MRRVRNYLYHFKYEFDANQIREFSGIRGIFHGIPSLTQKSYAPCGRAQVVFSSQRKLVARASSIAKVVSGVLGDATVTIEWSRSKIGPLGKNRNECQAAG
jgi:hypothetical protein